MRHQDFVDGSVLERIKKARPKLRPSEQAVVDYVIQNPREVPRYTITELARSASVSEASVNRCVHSLGYSGFMDFKLALSQEFAGELYNIAPEILETDKLEDIIKKFALNTSNVISYTANLIDPGMIGCAADMLLGATNVHFYGVGGSGNVAHTSAHVFLKAGFKASAHTDSYLQLVNSSLLGPGDVVVAISQSGTITPLLNALKLAKKHGAQIIMITENKSSFIKEQTDLVIPSYSREQPIYGDLLEGKFSQLYIVFLIYLTCVLRSRHRVGVYLERTAEAVKVFVDSEDLPDVD